MLGTTELANDYWSETRRPLVNLLFVAPILVVYEAGLLVYGAEAVRNGADIWLRQLLELAGFTQYFLLPFATCGLLLAWHHLSHDRWTVRTQVLYGMALESAAFSGVLLILAHTHRVLFSVEVGGAHASQFAAVLISFLGAGIYEELVFRMLLLTGLSRMLRALQSSRAVELTVAVALSSFLFAAAHHQVDVFGFRFHSAGDPWIWPLLGFRFAAGVLFCFLYLSRGFGIAVGAHLLYDVIVTC